jgi:hypothetical protein
VSYCPRHEAAGWSLAGGRQLDVLADDGGNAGRVDAVKVEMNLGG